MRWWLLLALAGCADPSDLPARCEADIELTGLPGSQAQIEFSLQGGETRELCLVLDARANDRDVTFLASAPFFPSATHLELHGLDGTLLETGDDTATLRFVMPPGPRMHVLLGISAARSVASVGIGLSLEFSEVR